MIVLTTSAPTVGRAPTRLKYRQPAPPSLILRIPVSGSFQPQHRAGLTCREAAHGDAVHGDAIHVINTGATRQVTLKGLPVSLKRLYPSVTDGGRG